VVIGSGDHIFAQAAAELAASGCTITVVSRRGRVPRTLELAAGRRVVYIDALDRIPASHKEA
jgi:NAD(P)-dependent dehydrogenase (short-subunit alcohol dehydrogenase family)